MPKTFYVNEADIPADQKGAYAQKDGKWMLTDLDSDHPVIKTKGELESTQTSLKSEVANLTADKANIERERDEFKGKALPSGFRAVKKEVAELGEAAASKGFTAETIATVSDEVAAFKAEKAQTVDRDFKTKAAKAAGVINLDDFFERKATDNLKLESETVDGTEKFFVVSEKDGQKVKTAFDKDYLTKAEGFRTGAAALFAEGESGGNTWLKQESGKEGKTGNIYEKIRADKEAEQKATGSANTSFADKFNGRGAAA